MNQLSDSYTKKIAKRHQFENWDYYKVLYGRWAERALPYPFTIQNLIKITTLHGTLVCDLVLVRSFQWCVLFMYLIKLYQSSCTFFWVAAPLFWRFYLVTYRYLSAWSQSTAFAEEVECCVFMFQKWWAIAYFLIFLFWNNRIENLPSLRQKTVRMARKKLVWRPGTPRWSMRTKMAISSSSPFRPIRLVQLAMPWAIDDLLFAILCWWDVAYRGHIKVYCTLSPQHASKCQHVFLWSRASSENFRTLDQNLETVSAVESMSRVADFLPCIKFGSSGSFLDQFNIAVIFSFIYMHLYAGNITFQPLSAFFIALRKVYWTVLFL